MDISSTFLLLILAVTLLLGVRWRTKVRNLPPGPAALPLLGNILTMDKRAPFRSFMEWSKTYGPVMTVYLGPQRTVVLVGYDAVKEALVDRADDFAGRAPVAFIQKILKGYGFAISNGERWRQLRRFTLITLRDFGMGRRQMEEWIREESRHLLESFHQTKAAPFDPQLHLSRTISNVISALVFGQRFDYEDAQFRYLLQIISEFLQFGSSGLGQLYNVFPWLMDRLTSKHNRIMDHFQDLRTFCMDRVQKHMESLDPEEPRDLIDCFLVRLNQEKDNPKTEFHYDNMVGTVQTLFIAGTETTSTTIRYALMLLIKHPEIQDRMRKEIDSVVGRERSPSMEDIKSLPFTDAVIHEVERYVDLVPLNVPHYALHDFTFRGYTIPKGTVILPMLHSVLRDERYWEKPWSFYPKHFLDADGNFKNNPAFMAFSAGKRSCVGESLARMELFMFITTLLQHFTFTCPGGPQTIDSTPEISGFANLPRNYQLIATPR